jgi:outer membrane lipoprotein-sorting protein
VLTPWILLGLSPTLRPFREVEARIVRAYKSVNTLEQTIRGSTYSGDATIHVYYKRPGKFAFAGITSRGKFSLRCDGHRTFVYEQGKWRRQANLVQGLTGLCQDLLDFMPDLLLSNVLSGNKIPPDNDRVQVQEAPNGLLRVTDFRPPESYAIWIQRESFFISKIDDTLFSGSNPPIYRVTLKYSSLRVNHKIASDVFRPPPQVENRIH